jgi:ribosome maturation factor RimP
MKWAKAHFFVAPGTKDPDLRIMPGTARETLLDRVTEIARRAAKREGLDVWDVELAGSGRARIVRIFIDKPGGVTHADCELVSNQVGTVLDVEDVIPGSSYHLEVSSPGLERKLVRADHFERSVGCKARIQLREPVAGQRRWEGIVRGCAASTVTLENSAGEALQIRLDNIDKANLKFEW